MVRTSRFGVPQGALLRPYARVGASVVRPGIPRFRSPSPRFANLPDAPVTGRPARPCVPPECITWLRTIPARGILHACGHCPTVN